MKISESWLREWFDPKISIEEIAEQLTMAGIEVEEIISQKPTFTNVVIGKVIDINQHPDADKLRVCSVDVGDKNNLLQIVCGAKNVHKDAIVPVAVIGAKLDNGNFKIKKSKLRGVESQGMICSESELGLADSSDGIWLLTQDAPVGKDLIEYLNLNSADSILDISITPNRGDCLSAKGLSREIAALNNSSLQASEAIQQKVIKEKNCFEANASRNDMLNIVPNFLTLKIKNINNSENTKSPDWLVNRLKQSNIKPISPIVDITNYVMLELGQPMHAFDFDKVDGDLIVRKSKTGENLEILNNKIIKLDQDTLVITDNNKILSIAGIIGGLESSITQETQNIILEVATYQPETIARARKYGISTDSSYRYERGVDYNLPKIAISRAATLITEICGGECGEISGYESKIEPKVIILNQNKVNKILGSAISQEDIDKILSNLDLKKLENDTWQIPGHRYDLKEDMDLVEEVARVYGYANLPSKMPERELKFISKNKKFNAFNKIRNILMQQSYHEAINYSFCDPKVQQLLDQKNKSLDLINPISEDLKSMRTTILAGLLPNLRYNFDHQNTRVKLFEVGNCYFENGEQEKLALVIGGSRFAENWLQNSKDKFDFYDLKGDLLSLFSNFDFKNIKFVEINNNKILHPAQSAEIIINNKSCGFVGTLHPALQQKLGLPNSVIVAELDAKVFLGEEKRSFKVISKYPAVRRDLAILINNEINSQKITDLVANTVNDLLKSINIFDVYTGSNITEGSKSLAISLILQADNRTLVDDEVNSIIKDILAKLKSEYNATIRDDKYGYSDKS